MSQKWTDPHDYDDIDHHEAIVFVYGLAAVLIACVALAALWLWLPAR
jgi:hypothetical protein